MQNFEEYVARCGTRVVKDGVTSLQMNLGYVCNLNCRHCHLQAGPHRTESMGRRVVDDCLGFVARAGVKVVDITGGAPELNPHLQHLVEGLRRAPSVESIILRSNLTLLEQPEFADLPSFLAAHGVDIVASLPCYLEENVAAQRGDGVYPKSIEALKKLNRIGFGCGGPRLNLVYNPGGAFLPGPQPALEDAYKENLAERFGVTFDSLFTITNMAIGRFRDDLEREGSLQGYLELLAENFRPANLERIMCRSQISVNWQGTVYDCDFNQVLGMPVAAPDNYIGNISLEQLSGSAVRLAQHCFACTAGSGSSCQGSLSC